MTQSVGRQAEGKYRKVICSGHIIEVYEFEEQPMTPQKKSIDELTEYLITGDISCLYKPDWVKELEKKQKRKQNANVSRANFRRLILSNFDDTANFITLTFAENITDVNYANKLFDAFMKRLRRRYGDEFKYAVVLEFQQRGAVHYHMLADLGLKWENEEECRLLENEFREQIWKHGWVDIKSVNHVDNIGAYMAKYMAKRMDDERLQGKKAYRTSHNLSRPVILKGEEAEKILEMYEIEQKKEVYATTYESEYIGTIQYREYNMKRNWDNWNNDNIS